MKRSFLLLLIAACGGNVDAPSCPPPAATDAGATTQNVCPANGIDPSECSYAANVCQATFGAQYKCGVLAGNDPYVARTQNGQCIQDNSLVGSTCTQTEVGDAGVTLTCCTLR